jgi:fluoride ion exporter CrcB/FEX
MRKIETASALIARIVWYGGYTLLAYLLGAFVMGTGDVWEWEQGERATAAFTWALGLFVTGMAGEWSTIESMQRGFIDLFMDEEDPTP